MIPCRGNAGPPGSIPSKTVPRPISANVTRRERAPMKLLSAALLSRLQHRGGAYAPVILVLENPPCVTVLVQSFAGSGRLHEYARTDHAAGGRGIARSRGNDHLRQGSLA